MSGGLAIGRLVVVWSMGRAALCHVGEWLLGVVVIQGQLVSTSDLCVSSIEDIHAVIVPVGELSL